MKRRLLALALALCIALSLVPAAAAADTGTNTLYYQSIWSPEETFRDPLVFEPNLSYSYRFFTDEACTNEVTKNLIFTADEDSPADAVIPTRDTDRDGNGNEVAVWYLYAKRLGTGTISYTDGSTTYTLAVSCVLPEQGLSSTPELTKETYLVSGQASFVVNKPFYYVFPEETKIQSATVDQYGISGDALSVKVLAGKPNVCELTVTAAAVTPRAHSFLVAFTLVRENSPTGTKEYMERISLRDATPRFGFRQVRWNNALPNGFRDNLYSQLNATVNRHYSAGFFFGEDELPVTSVEFIPNEGTDSDAVTAAPNRDYPQYWELGCVKIGSGTLVCKTADTTYELPVAVSLPSVAFFTEQRRAADTLLSGSFHHAAGETGSTFWLIREDGFTAAEIGAIALTCETWNEAGQQVLDPADYLAWTPVSRSGEAARYDLKFTVNDNVHIPEQGIELIAELEYAFGVSLRILSTVSSVMTVSIDGTDYTVGFGYVQGGAVSLNTDGKWSQQYTLPLETNADTNAAYRRGQPEKSWGILAATGTTSSFAPAAEEIQNKITVERVWLERRSGSSGADGNTDTFSFAPDVRQLSLTENLTTDGVPIYVADEVGEAYLYAQLNVDGTSGTIYTRIHYRRQTVANETFDTVEALNTWLAEHAEAIADAALDDEADTTWNLYLNKNGSYTGTIVIPERLGSVHANSGIAIWGAYASLNGSINLNGAKIDTISHLLFTSQNREGVAIQNGASVVDGCTFDGYETALSGALFPHNCTFKNNTTALVLELANTRLRSDMYNCLFEKNDTAVRVKSITLDSAFLSPYHLRLHDSAFLNNTTDFNVQTEGTFYFLRNYFADSGSPTRAANTLTPNGATVYVNPVWKYRSDTGALRELTLVEGKDTRLPVNEDWSNTSIAADSLTAATQIALADENDNTVATWSDFREQAPAQQSRFALYSADETGTDTTPDGFRPGVSIDTQPTGEQTVTVADSAALAEKTPLLTIPCALKSAVVRLNGKPVASELEDGKLSFRVTTGGTYTVRPGTSEKYEDGKFTIQNAPEDAATAIAALYDAKGRFLTAATAQITNGAATILLKKPDSATCRIYYLTANNTPAN